MKELNLSVWGDSLMQGVLFDNESNKYYINGGIVPKIAKELNFNIKNFSRFGMNTNKATGLYKNTALKDNADVIILEYGGNDCNYDWEKVSQNPDGEHYPVVPLPVFTENVEFMINYAKSLNKTVVMTTLPPLDSDKFFNFITRNGLCKDNIMLFLGDKEHIYRHHERYNTAIIMLAKKHNLLIADLRDSFLQQKCCKNLLCEDGIHPNISGQNLMYDTFINFYKNIVSTQNNLS